MAGEFADTVIAIPGSRSEIVMLRPPGAGAGLELPGLVRPGHEPGSPAAMSPGLGLRNVAFEVNDPQAAAGRPAADGYAWLAAWVNTSTWRMADVPGPQGITASLARRTG